MNRKEKLELIMTMIVLTGIAGLALFIATEVTKAWIQ